MAKTAKTLWYCTSCGNESPKWMGRCPACGEWNTMVEAPAETRKSGKPSSGTAHAVSKPRRLNEIDSSENARLMLGMGELDRLLGGGIVPGSLVLIGGEPGIGKSTLSLQIPLHCKDIKTLYVSGEESARQVKMRAERLGGDEGNCYILCETRMEDILAEAESMQPGLMIVDSVQTMYTDGIESAPGSVSQIKEVAAQLLRFAKSSGVPVILIGHITKDGYIAGPKILEHIVDVVLQFEGDNRGAYRIMRSIKNRFGSTSELAVYEMTGAKDNYDYLEKFMPDTPTASLMSGGGCSYEYANRDGGSTQILVTEMPYYVDERVSDTSLTSRRSGCTHHIGIGGVVIWRNCPSTIAS